MTDLDLLHFEQLKTEVQAQYLKEYTPSYDEISKWKGIDIIYFQEDLRKKAKGNISEKSFYTYFKNSPVTKLPRIDMLTLLSVYAGYTSWFDFKKQHLFAGELLQDDQDLDEESQQELNKTTSNSVTLSKIESQPKIVEVKASENFDLQSIDTENQLVDQKINVENISGNISSNTAKKNHQRTAWIAATSVFVILLGLLGFKDEIFQKTYTYCFTDADRNQNIQSTIEIKVIKQNESPLFYRIKPGECFYYQTKDKNIQMQISSTVYENLEINRNLENAPEEETIELKPDDYKMAVYYYSTKDVSGNPSEQINIKRRQLENRISNDAVISQVYDNEIYGIETLDKQKYITLVTTPTTSLKNLSVIEMKTDKKGKIISIKFKISTNESNK
ncbi:hypothetical protein K0U91_04740 [Chryseobacterium chendengshani]|uniref:hypothetical protein n=1 Tax=Chryseobacterium sp. LJ668 TaxID=2864040 RepID=UPI001C68AA6B|nr:hypothetical protein [Chryseobacterium sp. LJ668]MBW8521774.1 hypothetical protein [Chryseobacterium sp. LJ668]QYK17436.1 hypothetical protein K0U91_04740 [Chryseobacterium sp. LJ668]